MWEFEFQKSKYFIEIGGVTLYFKTIDCPDEQNKFKSCQPENLEQLKLESELYKKIKEYALQQVMTSDITPKVGTTGAVKATLLDSKYGDK